jgi:hypothetical protein
MRFQSLDLKISSERAEGIASQDAVSPRTCEQSMPVIVVHDKLHLAVMRPRASVLLFGRGSWHPCESCARPQQTICFLLLAALSSSVSLPFCLYLHISYNFAPYFTVFSRHSPSRFYLISVLKESCNQHGGGLLC